MFSAVIVDVCDICLGLEIEKYKDGLRWPGGMKEWKRQRAKI